MEHGGKNGIMGYIIQKFSFLIKIMIINKKIFLKEKKPDVLRSLTERLENGKVVFSAHLQLFSLLPLSPSPSFQFPRPDLCGSKVVSL